MSYSIFSYSGRTIAGITHKLTHKTRFPKLKNPLTLHLEN